MSEKLRRALERDPELQELGRALVERIRDFIGRYGERDKLTKALKRWAGPLGLEEESLSELVEKIRKEDGFEFEQRTVLFDHQKLSALNFRKALVIGLGRVGSEIADVLQRWFEVVYICTGNREKRVAYEIRGFKSVQPEDEERFIEVINSVDVCFLCPSMSVCRGYLNNIGVQIHADIKQITDEDRITEFLPNNFLIFKRYGNIIKNAEAALERTLFMVVSNPIDILTYVFKTVSGADKVFGFSHFDFYRIVQIYKHIFEGEKFFKGEPYCIGLHSWNHMLPIFSHLAVELAMLNAREVEILGDRLHAFENQLERVKRAYVKTLKRLGYELQKDTSYVVEDFFRRICEGKPVELSVLIPIEKLPVQTTQRKVFALGWMVKDFVPINMCFDDKELRKLDRIIKLEEAILNVLSKYGLNKQDYDVYFTKIIAEPAKRKAVPKTLEEIANELIAKINSKTFREAGFEQKFEILKLLTDRYTWLKKKDVMELIETPIYWAQLKDKPLIGLVFSVLIGGWKSFECDFSEWNKKGIRPNFVGMNYTGKLRVRGKFGYDLGLNAEGKITVLDPEPLMYSNETNYDRKMIKRIQKEKNWTVISIGKTKAKITVYGCVSWAPYEAKERIKARYIHHFKENG